jgi:hypothetical protein
MFQSMFIIIFLIGAIDGGIIQPQTVGLENWQTEDKLHEMDGINVTGKPSELSPNILGKNGKMEMVKASVLFYRIATFNTPPSY